MSGVNRIAVRPMETAPRFEARSMVIGLAVIGWVAIALMVASVLVGSVYHLVAYDHVGRVRTYAAVGLLVALLATVPSFFQGRYRVESMVFGDWKPSRSFVAWNTAVLSLAVIAFLTKTTAQFSRGWVVIFYLVGVLTLMMAEGSAAAMIRHALRRAWIGPRRIMLVGTEREIAAFHQRAKKDAAEAERLATRIVALTILPEATVAAAGAASANQALAQGIARARETLPDDIVILTPWSDHEKINAIVEGFSVVPVPVHVDGGAILDRWGDSRVSRVGAAVTLSVSESPLSPAQVLVKRVFDIVVATLGLIVLAPVLLAVALGVILTSPGPVFFRQRRLGFNQREFRIFKFRTMTSLDDGATVVQAKVDDPRITRFGRWLRRFNIDELPQLINVVRGEMSLVGPRPHAVAHDLAYQQRILRYPRRLNMKPGITGWAQISGLRGETDTDEKMRKRVESDLYYIDNWSIALDLYILVMTVLSGAAYRNAR